MALTAEQQKRRTALLALVKRHDIGLDEPYSGAEDLSEMLDDEYPATIHRFGVVTQAAEWTYIYTEPTLADAQWKAFEFITDDLYRETPIEIVDLDGEFVDDGVEHSTPKFRVSWQPNYRLTPWTKTIGYIA